MEASLPTVLVRPGEADRIVGGHPWVYGGSLLRLTHPAEDGALVQVKDHRQRFLGTGFFNSKSKIQVRVLTTERVDVNESFFEGRIRAALEVRKRHLPGATSFRVVNAESDFLSGLLLDRTNAYSSDPNVVSTSSIEDEKPPRIIQASSGLSYTNASSECARSALRPSSGAANFW